jgi:DNA-directed RNA polymerase subunit L
MDIKFLKESKDEIEAEIPSLTLVELLRVYLNEDENVTFAAWKRDHPSVSPILKVKAKDAKKAVKSAIEAVLKDLEKVSSEFKGLKF